MKSFVLFLIMMMGIEAAAAERNPCVDIEDAEARLACFDAQHAAPAPPAAETQAPVEPPQAAAPAPAAPAADPVAPAAVPSAAAATTAVPKSEKTWLGDEKVNLSSTITGILAAEKQKMVFQLENDQIWIQSTPRSLPFEEGDAVTIKNANFGGYFLRSESGLSTRVQRIQ